MRVVCLLLVGAVASLSALVSAYHVDPKTAAMSGKARPDLGVSEVITTNFDEPITASLFCGARGAGGGYHVSLRTYPGDVEIASGDTNSPRDHSWATCTLVVSHPDSFIKGRQVEVRWTRSGSDSIQYYYQSGNRYQFGHMRVGSTEETGKDLACRLYGRLDPISDVWRACVNHGDDPKPDDGGLAALDSAKSIGVKWLREDFLGWDGWATLTSRAESIYNRYLSDSFDMIGILGCGRTDTSISSYSPGDDWHTWQLHPPRNLWPQDQSDSNFWAGYCCSIMGRMPTVQYWEVWPEANAWFWADPDIAYYQGSSPFASDTINTARERCSLYVRMCQIAESIAHTLGGERKIVAGGVWRLTDVPNGVGGAQTGVDWLVDMFELAENSYGGVENCFDVVSTHPYTWHMAPPNLFDEEAFRTVLDTARAVMRNAGYPGMELWATEYGWPRWNENDTNDTTVFTDTLAQADDVGKFLVSAIASQSDPHGGYDRAVHYDLTSYHATHGQRRGAGGFGFLDSTSMTQPPLVSQGWAFAQLNSLSGKRLNGRVMMGGTKDDSVRMYEFEDPTSLKKTWVCWKNQLATVTPPPVVVTLPARSDTSFASDLAYDNDPPSGPDYAAANGWLQESLTARPVFITETSVESRPELAADSVWMSKRGSAATFYVKIRNRDTLRATPDGCLTWARITWNGDSICSFYTDQVLQPRDTLTVFFPTTVPVWMSGEGLLKADLNPGMLYVEKEGIDDNQAYRRLYVP